MPKKPQRHYKDAEIADAVRKAHGMMSGAAAILGCSVPTIHNHKDAPVVAEAIHESREATKDMAELKLIQAIQDGEAWAICFYLKTQAKDRGYVERSEHDHTSGGQTIKSLLLED